MTRPIFGTTIFIVGRDEGVWDEEVHHARDLGVEHLEIFLEYPSGNGGLRERQIRRLRNLVKGVEVTVHAPTSWPSLITPHEQLQRLSLQEVKDTLMIAAKLDARLFTLRGGPIPFPRFRRGRDAGERFKEGIGELLPLAQELGQPLAVENLARGYPSTSEELEEALAMGLGLSLDVEQARGEGQDPRDLLEKFRERTAKVALGPGVELEPLIGYLKEKGFAGFLTLSLPPDPGRWDRVRGLLAEVRGAWEGG